MCGSGFSLTLLLELGIMSFFNFFIIAGPQPLEGDVLLKDAQGSCFATDLSLSILKQIDYISLLVITYTIEKGNI